MSVQTEVLSDSAVRLRCRINRPVEKVFDAWIRPEQITRWLVCTPEGAGRVTEFDPVVGGRYRIEMGEGSNAHAVNGTYQTVDRPLRLAFTWVPETSEHEKGETLVTVDLLPDEGATLLILTHERLSNTASRDEHAQGWDACLSGLTELVASS